MNSLGAVSDADAWTPRMFPAASTRTVMPAAAIQPASRLCTSRIGLEKKRARGFAARLRALGQLPAPANDLACLLDRRHDPRYVLYANGESSSGT